MNPMWRSLTVVAIVLVVRLSGGTAESADWFGGIFRPAATAPVGRPSDERWAQQIRPAQPPLNAAPPSPLLPKPQPEALPPYAEADVATQLHKKLADVRLEAVPTGDLLPEDRSGRLFVITGESTRQDRPGPAWGQFGYQWLASNLSHQPLYFDDQILERYGQTIWAPIQPALSAAHFFGTLPVMPYKIGFQGPCCRVSTLGYYRPGSPTPCLCQGLPLSLKGTLLEQATLIGFILLLP